MIQSLTHDLSLLQQMEQAKETENDDFLLFVRHHDGSVVDNIVHVLNTEISEAIDCTRCGNCCRSLMINVEPGEPDALAVYLEISTSELKQKYIEESQQGRMIVNTIPCHFLADNKCTVYEYRFTECREFPHLHKPGFIRRLPGTLMHYGRCPIIFNVIESLKTELNYEFHSDE